MLLRCLFALLLGGATTAHAAPDRTAQVEFATAGALYGLGLGVLTSVETDVNLRPAAWITAATTAGGLFGGLALVDELDMSVGQVRLTTSIAAWSIVDAGLLGLWGDLGDDATLWVMAGAGALGIGGGLAASSAGFDPSPGDISMLNSGGLWMVPAGLLLGVTLDLGSGDHLIRDVFVLTQLGLGAGAWIAASQRPTREQVLTLDLGLLAGGLGGALLGGILLLNTDSIEVFTATTLVGMGLGAWLAVRSTGFGGGANAGEPDPTVGELRVQMPLIGGRF